MRFKITRTFIVDVNEDQWDFHNEDPITEEGVLLNFLTYWSGRDLPLTYMDCTPVPTTIHRVNGEEA